MARSGENGCAESPWKTACAIFKSRRLNCKSQIPRLNMTPQSAPWITYRPDLKVLDCTIRDGGLINNHQFSDELVRAVYEACVEAGVDYMEVGYKACPKQHSRGEFGPWKFCDEELLDQIFNDHDADKTGLK